MIINLTQHPATAEQIEAGVVDLQGDQLELLKELLTFENVPQKGEVDDRAHDIALLAMMNGLGGDDDDDPIPTAAMIGGAPYLMGALERELIYGHFMCPMYSFTKRESVEQPQADGSVRKTAVFRHAGWVLSPNWERRIKELRPEAE